LSKKAEIFNNFGRIKHAGIFEIIKPSGEQINEQFVPLPIQKLMSAPIMGRQTTVLGVIQISHKGSDSRSAPDFTREQMRNLELAAELLAASSYR
jgi:hypothetical protein